LLCFFAVWFRVQVRGQCGYLAKPGVHNASYRQPKRNVNTAERQAAYNLHYVNIALGTVFPGVPFCLSAGAALAGFVLQLKILPHKNKSRHVLQQGSRKKHDRKTGQKGRQRECLQE
jgi:hypothetical protein